MGDTAQRESAEVEGEMFEGCEYSLSLVQMVRKAQRSASLGSSQSLAKRSSAVCVLVIKQMVRLNVAPRRDQTVPQPTIRSPQSLLLRSGVIAEFVVTTQPSVWSFDAEHRLPKIFTPSGSRIEASPRA